MAKRRRAEERCWEISPGKVLRPTADQTIAGGVYDSLYVEPHVRNVVFDRVLILADVTVLGTATGSIIVPFLTHAQLGRNDIGVIYRSWEQIEVLIKQRA